MSFPKGSTNSMISRLKPWFNMKVALILLFALGLGTASWHYWQAQQSNSRPAMTYREYIVKKSDMTEKVSALGLLEPVRSHDIKTKADGTILQLHVKETDSVEADQVLLTMDNSSSLAKVASSKASLSQARYELKKATDGTPPEELAQAESTLAQDQINYEQAAVNLKRLQTLFNGGAVTKVEFEKAQADLQLSEKKLAASRAKLEALRKNPEPAQIETLQARVQEAEANLQSALQDSSGAEIRSPFTGRVLALNVEAGAFVPQNTVLASVADLSTVRGSFYVNELDISKVKLGMEARVKVDALGGKVFTGKVTQVGQMPKTIDNIVNYEVLVDIVNSSGELRSGMTMSTEIIINNKPNALSVPLEALINRSGQAGVLIAGENEPRFTPVKTGIRSETGVEVLEGLKEGDKVLIEGQQRRVTNVNTTNPFTPGAGVPAGRRR